MGDFRGRDNSGVTLLPNENRKRDSRDRRSDSKNFGNDNKNFSNSNNRDRDRDRERRGGFRGGRGGPGGGRAEDRWLEKLNSMSGPTYDLPTVDQPEGVKKFTNRCRLFVGNVTDGTSMEEFEAMFKPFGEVSEPYLNPEKAFGFIKMDFRESAEKARRALDGTVRNGRTMKVRFSSMGCTLKVRRLSPFVSNELLELAFSIFGDLERANVIVDERGKSTGEAIVEFCRKPAAMQCAQKCNDCSFFLTESIVPVEVEILKEDDMEDGLPDKTLPRKHPDFIRERAVGPRFSVPGTFEHEFGQRWKQLYELEKQRRDQLRTEMRLEAEKLQDQLEFSRREHETEMLREQLRQRELEQERSKSDWEQRQMQREQERRRYDEMMQRCQEQMHERMRQTEEDMKRRTQENRIFMQANELSSLLDQQEQAIWGADTGAPQAPPPPLGGSAVSSKQLPDTFPSYGAMAAAASSTPTPWGQPPPNFDADMNGAKMDRGGVAMGGGDQSRARAGSPPGYRGSGGRGGARAPPGGSGGGFHRGGNRGGRDHDSAGPDYGKRQRMF